MRRIATLTFVAGWVGFLAVSSATGLLAILVVADLAATPAILDAPVQRAATWIGETGNGGVLAVMAETLGALMTLSLFLAGGWLVRTGTASDRAAGERLVVAALAAVGLLYIAGSVWSVPLIAGTGTPFGFAFVVLASVLGVLIDRVAEIEDAEDDEADFRAAVALIGHRLAQDALSRDATPKRDDE